MAKERYVVRADEMEENASWFSHPWNPNFELFGTRLSSMVGLTRIEKLLSMGAKEYEALTRRGEAGFVTASVVDPFANVLGIMYNLHYSEVLGSTEKV